jgi:hypothetical protein
MSHKIDVKGKTLRVVGRREPCPTPSDEGRGFGAVNCSSRVTAGSPKAGTHPVSKDVKALDTS